MSNTILDDNPEVKKDSTVHMTKVSAPDLMQEIIKRFSSWLSSQKNSGLVTSIQVNPPSLEHEMKDTRSCSYRNNQ